MRRLITAALAAAGATGALAQSDILETAAANGNFDTLVSLLVTADLEDALDNGTFTVFAPTDDAFAELPKGTLDELRKPENRDTLREILTYHVLDFELSAPQHPPSHPLRSAEGLNGDDIEFDREGSTVFVNGNKIVNRNIRCSNGIIQVIDGVLLPPEDGNTIVDIASNDERFTTLVAAVKAAGLADSLGGETLLTVLAPTNDAFGDLPSGTLKSLLKEKNRDQLIGILKDHVIKGSLNARDLAGRDSVETLRGTSLPISIENGSLTIGGAGVILNDIGASNGVVHVIDSVIVTGGDQLSDNDSQRPGVVRINANWNNNINRDGISADRIEIRCNGGGSVRLTNVDADEIVTIVNGGARVTLTGNADSHKATVSGGGVLDADELQTDSTKMSVSGGGNASVYAEDSLNFSANAGAVVSYVDTGADVHQQVSKYATIKRISSPLASNNH